MIKRLRIEILFSGLLQLIFLIICGFKIAGVSSENIFIFLAGIGSGTSIFLYAILVTLSYFLGTIFENFISAIVCLKTNRGPDAKKIIIWQAKSFFFASFVWVLAILILLMFFLDIESYEVKLAILIIGVLLLIETLGSLSYWWYWEEKIKSTKT